MIGRRASRTDAPPQAPRGSEFIRESPPHPPPAYTCRGDFNRPRATQLPQKTPPDTERGPGMGRTALHRSTLRGHGKRHGWMERAPSPLRLTASPPWERIHSRKPPARPTRHTPVGAISIAQGQPRWPKSAPPDTKRGVGRTALHRSTMRGHGKRHWWMERAPSPLRLTASPPWERIHSRKPPARPPPAYTCRGDFNRPRATQLPQKGPSRHREGPRPGQRPAAGVPVTPSPPARQP